MQIVDTTPASAMQREEKGSWAFVLDPGESLSSPELLISLIDEHDCSPEEADAFEGMLLSVLESIRAKRLAVQAPGQA